MSRLDQYTRGLLDMFSAAARLVLGVLETIEAFLRALMSTAKLTGNEQSLLMIGLLAVFLFTSQRLLRGWCRSAVSFVSGLTLAHALEHLARG